MQEGVKAILALFKRALIGLDKGKVLSQIASIEFMAMECGLRIDGQVVLDVGCGLGARSIIFALLGAKKVYGVDVDSVHLNILKSNLARLADLKNPHLKNIELVQGEVQNFLPPLPLTLIYCNETLSHLWDRWTFYTHSYNILSPGGTLFISDSNNILNKRLACERKKLWREAESPKGAIFEGRKRFIKEKFPELNEEELDYLTINTCYQRAYDIILAVKSYLTYGKLENESRFIEGVAPFDPDYFFLPCEALIDPFEVRACLERVGFKVSLFPHFCGAKRKILRPINLLLQLLPHRFSFKYARAVHIVATK